MSAMRLVYRSDQTDIYRRGIDLRKVVMQEPLVDGSPEAFRGSAPSSAWQPIQGGHDGSAAFASGSQVDDWRNSRK